MSILCRFSIINENNNNKKSLKDLVVCLCSLVFASMEELSKAVLETSQMSIQSI